jgi:hypothetical protein
MTQTQLRFLPIALTVGLLGGLCGETLLRPKPADAEPYHRRVREASQRVPLVVGQWLGKEERVEAAAIALLRPNVMLQRRYNNASTGRVVSFLLVQCKDARDMAGHYPPNCYPGQGWRLANAQPMDWRIGDRVIGGKEYEFTRVETGQPISLFVCSLMILPSGTFVRDISEVRAAAADYLRQFYGAAQIQLVLDGSVPAEERKSIFCELVGANMPMLETLCSGGTR